MNHLRALSFFFGFSEILRALSLITTIARGCHGRYEAYTKGIFVMAPP